MAVVRALWIALWAGLWALLAGPAQASYTGFNIFGDSLSDLGNLYLSTSRVVPVSPPYDNGRFSNGPIWVEQLAPSLGLPTPAALLARGSDYAFGTATASRAVPGATPVPTTTEQVGTFLLQHGGIADPTALYSMWIGSNDVLDVLGANFDTAQAEPLLAASARAETSAIRALANAGAKDVLVGLVPDISVTPAYNGAPDGVRQEARDLSQYYNNQLKADILSGLRFVNIYEMDTFSLLDDAVADPSAYDFGNVTDACYTGSYLGGGDVCGNPDDYLFWDQVHPTEAGHRAIAALAAATLAAAPIYTVPLPASAPLFGASLLLVGVARFGVKWHRTKAAR